MSTIITRRSSSNRPNSHTSSSRFTRYRAAFARGIVFSEFGNRNARALDQGSFEDRKPGERPKRLDHLTAAVVEDLGQAALRHWLSQAAEAENLEERQAAQEIAREIARLADLPFDEPLGEEAA